MKALNNKTAKKNQSIIRVTPWNHHFDSSDFGTRSNRVDEYKVQEVRIHSIGKKQLIVGSLVSLTDDKLRADPNGNFLTNYDGTVQFFVFKVSEIAECIANIRKHDKHATSTYTIIK